MHCWLQETQQEANFKQTGHLKPSERKNPLTCRLYRYLSNTALTITAMAITKT